METRTTDRLAGEQGRGHDGRKATGVVLVALGLVFLAGQLLNLGLGMLPLLSIGFVAAGVATRQAGWFIPAGILGGIGLGSFLNAGPLATLGEPRSGGVFLLCFALGWVSVYLLTRLLTAEPQRWALIPGGIMALIGGGVLLDEPGARGLELIFGALNVAWPLALIAAGAYMLVRRRQE